jgi:Universal stress protein family
MRMLRGIPADIRRTILCAIDHTHQAGTLMRWASEFSQRIGADLSFLHVMPPISDVLTWGGRRPLLLSMSSGPNRDRCLMQSLNRDGAEQHASVLDRCHLP